jgi:hypothetical protein
MNEFNRNDFNEFDFSTIISASSTNVSNINNISENTIVENIVNNSSNSSKVNLNVENVDLKLLNYLNQEFVELGLDSIYVNHHRSSEQVNFNLLFKNSADLLERLKRQLAINDRIQENIYKLDRENEFFLKRQETLKETNEITNRELGSLEEKFRQSQLKVNSSNKIIKDLNEENRKLQCIIEQRDNKYKHERKKFEKEIEKLKERIQVLTTGKTKDLPFLDLSESVRNPYGPRQTWNTDSNSSKKQLELYTELIRDYDFKTKELAIENTDLKSFIASFYSNLKQHSPDHDDDSTTQNTDQESFLTEITRLPFENTFPRLNREIVQSFKLLTETIQSNKKNTQSSSISSDTFSNSNLNNNTNNNNKKRQLKHQQQQPTNLTLSSINSTIDDDEAGDNLNDFNIDEIQMRTKRYTHNKDDILNATFTVDKSDNEEDDLDDDVKHITDEEECGLEEKMNNLEFLDDCKNLDQFDFINSLNQLEAANRSKMNKIGGDVGVGNAHNNNNQQVLSLSSSSSSSSSASTSFNNFEPQKKNEFFLHSNSNNKASEKIAQEKKRLLEQKLKLEKELNSFRQESSDLDKQKKEFLEEQEEYYENKLLSSFVADQSKKTRKK